MVVRFVRIHPLWSAVVALYLVLTIGLVVTPVVDGIWELALIWLLGPVVLGVAVQRSWVLLLPFIPPLVVGVLGRMAETSHSDADGMLIVVQFIFSTMSFGMLGMLCVIGGMSIRHLLDTVWGTRVG